MDNLPVQAPQTFETALRRLESLINDMESGRLGLEDMIKAFEEGQKLAAFCGEQLGGIEKRIEMLVKTPDGNITATPLPPRLNNE
jgi:exodeoxyribonuclease VII small subunit